MHILGVEVDGDDTAAAASQKIASVMLGGVRLTRVREGWVVETEAPVDLAELDAAVQWAKHAPAAQVSVAAEPLVSVDGEAGGDVVGDARVLFADQGGFGSDMLSGEDSVFGSAISDEQNVTDIDAERSRVQRMPLTELNDLCEAACAEDKDNAVLEIALEERIGKMLNDTAKRFSVEHDQLQRVTFWSAGAVAAVAASNLAIGVVLEDEENADRELEHEKVLQDVEYLDDVRIFLGGRRSARRDGHTFAAWRGWRAAREAAREHWLNLEDGDREDLSKTWVGEAGSTI
jgi:hypothetical protein